MIIDGAMGTSIQAFKLTEEQYRGEQFKDHHKDLKGNNDLLSITRPEVIKAIHRGYFEAGADIIETNSLCSSSISQSEYELDHIAYELSFAGAKIAKEVAMEFVEKTPDHPRFVAGSVGPTSKMLSLSTDVNRPEMREITFDQLLESYKVNIKGMIDGGVDLILIETIFDTSNCKAAIVALEQVNAELGTQIPLMISVTIDQSGRMLAGQTLDAFLISVEHASNLISVGLNCSLGPKEMLPYVKEFAHVCPFPVSVYANAGLPNGFGGYDLGADEMAEIMSTYLEKGYVNIIGGCCGTGKEHIAALAKIAGKYPPRPFQVGKTELVGV